MQRLLLISLLLPFFTIAQCIKGDCQQGIGVKKGIFTDNSEYIYTGNFIYGKFNGEGRVEAENYIAEGVFKDGNLVKGYIQMNTIYYSGSFKNNKLHGNNCKKVITSDNSIIISEGKFINGGFISGYEKFKDKDGFVDSCYYSNGEIIDCIQNDKNIYRQSDLDGPKVSEVELTPVENQLFVKILFTDIALNIKWDTGAYGIVFSKNDFEKIFKNGVEFYDLNLTKVSSGVLGIDIETKVYIISRLQIGEIVVRNVVCNVADINESLLGMDFFEKFTNVTWDKKKNSLKIYK